MAKKEEKYHKVKSIALNILINIILFSLTLLLIQAIKPQPAWEDYCGNVSSRMNTVEKISQPYQEVNMTTCLENQGTWQNGYCDYYYECQRSYDKIMEKYDFYAFIFAVIVAIIAVILGIILKLPSVSLGLLIGGLFLLIYGTARYWRVFGSWIKVIIMTVVLIILIWISYKKLKA